MRDGLRHALLVVAGLLGVLLVVSVTAWGLTTYGSVRNVVGNLAAQPDKAVSLQDQYEDMTIAFAGGSDSYTFRFNSAPIEVSKSQAGGMGRDDVINIVLDTYTSDLYNDRLTAGSPGFAGIFFNATGNLIYLVIMLIIAILFIAFVAAAILPFPEKPMPDRLKTSGKIIVIICILAFLFFAFTPGLIKSLAWGYIGNHDAARDVLDILEPALVGSLLRNALLVAALGGILYGVGYYQEMREGQDRRKQAHVANRYESRRESHIPYVRKFKYKGHRPQVEKQKRKGL